MEIDHVVIAAADMGATAARLWDEHGLAAVPGGRHPGHGTANQIVPLGDDYLEIMGVVDEAEAAASPLGSWVRAQTRDGDRLGALCLRTPKVDVAARRLGLEVTPMSRLRPDGVELRWRLAAMEEALAEPALPFFITWDTPQHHPGATPATHRATPHGIAKVELGIDEARLQGWIGAAVPRLSAVAGPPAVLSVTIATAAGPIVLT